MSEHGAWWWMTTLDESSPQRVYELLGSRAAEAHGYRRRRLTHDVEGCHE